MCASQQDTGAERQRPDSSQPHLLSPPSARTPKWSSILLTFRAPRRPQPDDGPLPGEHQVPVTEPQTSGHPPASSGLVSVTELPTATEPPTPSEPLHARELASPSESLPQREPQTAVKRPPGEDPPQRLAQARTIDSAGAYAASLLDVSLIVIGVALFLCALATLSLTWVWSWHAGSAGTFNLSHMHGICTSALGEIAQGASSNVASHCLWVDGTWTEAVALTAGGCILAVIGVARFVGALKTPA